MMRRAAELQQQWELHKASGDKIFGKIMGKMRPSDIALISNEDLKLYRNMCNLYEESLDMTDEALEILCEQESQMTQLQNTVDLLKRQVYKS